LNPYKAQNSEIRNLLDWIRREKVHFLLRDEITWFKQEMSFPDKLYRVIVVLREGQQKYGRNLPPNLDELDAAFTIDEALRKSILASLLRYKYVIDAQDDSVIILKHIHEKEVYCRIAAKHIVFYTSEFTIDSLFEVRQTPWELMPATYFLIFDEQRNQWDFT
jgi:hypothetical protein